ncbi:MAG TPA: RNA polymerase sigma-70 factor, partial [Gemmatimonadaceae bacterium]
EGDILSVAQPPLLFPARMDETSAMPAGDAELVRRIRAGDERALEVVFKAHYAGMASFVQRFVRSPDLAEELVQDVFLKLWSKREHLAEIETFRTYLFRAARNTALNYLRRAKLERRWREEQGTDDDPPTTFAADEETVEPEVALAVQEAINKLPPRCREIFLLSRDGGLTYAEIARSLEISVKTVETQMGRALKSLRASLHHFRE